MKKKLFNANEFRVLGLRRWRELMINSRILLLNVYRIACMALNRFFAAFHFQEAIISLKFRHKFIYWRRAKLEADIKWDLCQSNF